MFDFDTLARIMKRGWGARGAHQDPKSATVTDFREQPPEQEGRKEKEEEPQ